MSASSRFIQWSTCALSLFQKAMRRAAASLKSRPHVHAILFWNLSVFWLFDNNWLGFRLGITVEPLEILSDVAGPQVAVDFEGRQDVAQVSRNPIPFHQDSLNPAGLPILQCPILSWAPKTWHEKSCHYKVIARLVLIAWTWNDHFKILRLVLMAWTWNDKSCSGPL